jgi:hypothetical protein
LSMISFCFLLLPPASNSIQTLSGSRYRRWTTRPSWTLGKMTLDSALRQRPSFHRLLQAPSTRLIFPFLFFHNFRLSLRECDRDVDIEPWRLRIPTHTTFDDTISIDLASLRIFSSSRLYL